MPLALRFFESIANVMIRSSSPGGAKEPHIASAAGISAPQTQRSGKLGRLVGGIMARSYSLTWQDEVDFDG